MIFRSLGVRGQCNQPAGCGVPGPASSPYGGPPPAPPSYGGQPQPSNPYSGYPTVNHNHNKIIVCPSDSEAKKDGKGNYLACLPNKPSCPDDAACWYNGLNYYCCKMEKDPPYVTGPPVPPAPYGVPPSSGYGQQQSPSSGYGAPAAAPAAVPSSYGFIGQQAIPFRPPTNACGGGSGCAPSCGAGGCSLSQSAPCTLAGGCAQPPASPCGTTGCGIPSFPCRGILTAKGCWPSEEGRGGSYGQIASPSAQPTGYGQAQPAATYGQVRQPTGFGQIPQPTGYGQGAKTNGTGKIKGHHVPHILWYVNTEPKCCRIYPDNQNACPFNCPPPQQFRPQPSFPSNGFSPYGSNVGGGNVEPTPGSEITPTPLTEPPPSPPAETTAETTAVTEAVTTAGTTAEETTANEATSVASETAASTAAATTAAATTVANTESQGTSVDNTETLPSDQATTAAAADTPPSPPALLARDEILLDNISNDLETDSKKMSIGMNSHLVNYFDSVILDQQKHYLQSQRTANDAYARWLDNFYRTYQK